MVTCKMCQKVYEKSLQAHLNRFHFVSISKYQEMYTGEPIYDADYVIEHRNKVVNRDPSYRIKLSESSKNRWKDPEYRKNQIESLTAGQNTEVAKRNHSRGANNYFAHRTVEQREDVVEKLKEAWKDIESRGKRLETIRRVHNEPSTVLKHSEATKNYYSSLTEEQKEAKKTVLKETWAKPGNREKILKLSKIGLAAAMTEDVRKKIIETNKTPETKKRRSIAAIKRLSKMPQTSSLNIMFKEALNKKNLFPEVEYPIEFYQVDFCFPDKKIVVEVDGDYWHCNPEIYKEPKNSQQKRVVNKDKRERTYLLNRGWNLIRFWEKDLNNDVESCVNKVLEAVNG